MAVLLCWLVIGCSSGVRQGGTETLTGDLTYRERIMLPLGAQVRVRLEDVSLADAPAKLIAEQLIEPRQQVPVPFSLIYDPASIEPRHHYSLRAEIRSASGELLWSTTEPQAVFGAGQPADDVTLVLERTGSGSTVPPVAVAEAGRTFLYECDGVDTIIRTETGGALLRLPGRELRLRQVPAASGARYEGEGLLFWSKGNEALLEVAGEPRRQCVANPRRAPWAEAAMRGVDFRAIGNEPGWHLEIDDGKRIQLVTDYGERTIYTPAPVPRFEAGIVHYDIDTEAHRLKVEIEPVACQDSMSGEAFEARVSVTLDGDRYLGCGRYLATTK